MRFAPAMPPVRQANPGTPALVFPSIAEAVPQFANRSSLQGEQSHPGPRPSQSLIEMHIGQVKERSVPLLQALKFDPDALRRPRARAHSQVALDADRNPQPPHSSRKEPAPRTHVYERGGL